jgi:hypothetical protein
LPGQNLLQFIGGGPQKQTRFVSLFTSRFLIGLYTNKSPLRSPLDSVYSEYYHMGATDSLLDGLNSEVSVRSTLIRRPGNPKYSTALTASAIDSFYSFHESTGQIQVIADSTTDVEILTPTSETSIFTKTVGAGEGYFQGINLSMYIGDGIDTVKYIPTFINPITGQPIWNWGGAAPTVAPVTQVTQTGSAGVAWVASTVYSTMGLLLDSNGNIEQLSSVNATGLNSTRFGTSGTGQPSWDNTVGNSTTDGTLTWNTRTPVGIGWLPNHLYNNDNLFLGTVTNPSCIYDPPTNALYILITPGNQASITNTTKPPFNGIPGSITQETGPGGGNHPAKWFCLGPPVLWKPAHAYAQYVPTTPPNSFIVEPALPTGTTVQTIYLQTAQNASTSSASFSNPTWPVAPSPAGSVTNDGDLIWNFLGAGAWAASTAYNAWTASNATFSAISDSNGNFQVCLTSGVSQSPVHPTWATTYGSHTADGTVVWVCVGPNTPSWAASTQWYLPATGFAPPQPSQSYGGANVTDSNGDVEYVIASGKSQTPGPPSWAGIGSTTSDGGATWLNIGLFTAAGFSWTKNVGYVYSFKARTAGDIFVTNPPPLQIPGTNSPNPTGPLGPPTGSADGTVTTASPVTQIIGANPGAQIKLTLQGSVDPQFDTIEIFRSADGFSASGPYLFLTDIPMPPAVGGVPGTTSIIDFMPDLATALLPGLNPLITAPIAHVNDPPPGQFGSTQFVPMSLAFPQIPAPGTALIGQVYHQGRLWGFVGNSVFASGGPDTNPGNGFTAWPPDNEFPFDSKVIRLLSTTAGLFVFTTTDIGFIGGGPAITQYESQVLVPGYGILSPNAVTTIAGIPYIFTSDRQVIGIDPNGGITRVAHNIGDKLTAFDPRFVYLTYHSFGDQDNALFISDGSSQWYRCDINMAPDGKYTGPVWSPRATIAGGFQALQSVETSPGIRQLLIGPPSAGFVLARDSSFTTFADNGSSYESNFTIGCIVLAHPGQMAEVAFIEADFEKVGTLPKVSIMFDELSPTNGAQFETISNSFVSDPPKLYGPTATPNTIWMNRYYLGQTTPGNPGNTPLPAWCKFLQLQIDFGNTDVVENELLAFSIYGALWQDK